MGVLDSYISSFLLYFVSGLVDEKCFFFTFITLGFTHYLHRCFYYTRVCSCFSFFGAFTPVDAWDITFPLQPSFPGKEACEMSGIHGALVYNLHRFPPLSNLGGSSGSRCVAYSGLVLAISLPDYLLFVNGEFYLLQLPTLPSSLPPATPNMKPSQQNHGILKPHRCRRVTQDPRSQPMSVN